MATAGARASTRNSASIRAWQVLARASAPAPAPRLGPPPHQPGAEARARTCPQADHIHQAAGRPAAPDPACTQGVLACGVLLLAGARLANQVANHLRPAGPALPGPSASLPFASAGSRLSSAEPARPQRRNLKSQPCALSLARVGGACPGGLGQGRPGGSRGSARGCRPDSCMPPTHRTKPV
jgi:hypothetical protein